MKRQTGARNLFSIVLLGTAIFLTGCPNIFTKKTPPKAPPASSKTDRAASNRLFHEGLDAYAAGKLSKAQGLLEHALRLNPASDKARSALHKVKAERKALKKFLDGRKP